MTRLAGPSPSAVIAVPARSEAARIEACLAALGREAAGADAAVLVFANNCRDDTAARVRAFAAAAAAPILLVEAELAARDAHAGGARRRAMDAAAERVAEGGLLLTTDADSRVEPGWLAANRRAVAAGADAVCGVVGFDAREAEALRFPASRRLEARYATLQAEVTARLDPLPHDPWPNHLWAWGASLAVRAETYARAGGLPERELAEDRAFVERLERIDARVRHALDVRVVTSARRCGRAPGGLAALVDAYAAGGDMPCDAALEPILKAAERARARRRLRERLGGAAGFGEAWAQAERDDPALGARERLTPAQLPMEIARAERLLERLRPEGAAAPADSARAATAELW